MGIFSSLLPLCVYSSSGEKGEREEKEREEEGRKGKSVKKYVKEKFLVSVWTKKESSPLRQDGVKKRETRPVRKKVSALEVRLRQTSDVRARIRREIFPKTMRGANAVVRVLYNISLLSCQRKYWKRRVRLEARGGKDDLSSSARCILRAPKGKKRGKEKNSPDSSGY